MLFLNSNRGSIESNYIEVNIFIVDKQKATNP